MFSFAAPQRGLAAAEVKLTSCCIFLSQMMSQSNFLSSLQSFPKDTINDEMVELLAPYLEMEDYNMETAKRVSNFC